MMKKLSVIGSTIALACLVGSAAAANLDDATRQQVYNKAYEGLAAEQHQCQSTSSTPCGSAIPSDKVESIFNTAYVQVSGQQPSYEDYLQWKYLSNFPTSISSDKHFPQATEQPVSKKSAAVKEKPSTSAGATAPGTQTEKMKPKMMKKNCTQKK